MKCGCGYEGWAEIGQFKDEREPALPCKAPYRCPKCKTNKDIEYVDSIDTIRVASLYPHNCSGREGRKHQAVAEVVEFITGGREASLVGYSIHCPVCQWGSGSAISLKEFEKLKKKFPNLRAINADVGLAQIYKGEKSINDD